jgi:prepilin-type N-terminal cleavage/methylation domain-containing protein
MSGHSSRRSAGFALLEVLVAVVVLGAAGLGFVELVDAHTRALAQDIAREATLADEDRLLTAYALLERADLDLRLGPRTVGDYMVDVERPELTLYRIAIARRDAPDVEQLVTVVYRAVGTP